MAKNQFKAKVKELSLTSRFTVLPLVEKGDEFLCVDANFQFLMVSKSQMEEYSNLALPEVVNPALHKAAVEAAKPYLPEDAKIVERLRTFLKTKGAEGFADELQKAMA